MLKIFVVVTPTGNQDDLVILPEGATQNGFIPQLQIKFIRSQLGNLLPWLKYRSQSESFGLTIRSRGDPVSGSAFPGAP